MNIHDFDELQDQHGTNVVWVDGDGYHFCMGDGVDHEDEEYERLETECDGHPYIEWSVVMGDDLVNCISVNELSDFDDLPGLEQFVIDNIGPNCYTI